MNYEEEDFFKDSRKLSRKERKELSKKDRSKFKKSDRDQMEKQKAPPPKGDHHRGRVLSITPQGMIVDHEGQNIVCFLRGALKKENRQVKNLVTVGDFVRFEKLADNEGVISYVEPRKSTLSRADNLSRIREHLIAANIDQVLITASVVEPPLKPFLVDRYIIASKKGNMEPVILVNKTDLLPVGREEEAALFRDFIEAYERAGLHVIPVSTVTGEGIEQLKKMMTERASVFSGQSGVGKSSLINRVLGIDLEVGETVKSTKKGSHTTTTAQLIRLDFGGLCIDTPGIKSFGLWDLSEEEVKGYYPEFEPYAEACKFMNCSHLHEPDCAVIKAVEQGEISPLRYDSYNHLMEALSEEHRRR